MSYSTFLPPADSIIHGCVDEETAFVVNDYPYGRLRTQIRYWVESKPKFGDRFMAQTLNPKTGRWNKPKAGTYSALIIMYLEEQEDGRLFVKHAGVGNYASTEDVEKAIELFMPEFLNDVQKVQLAGIIGMNKVMAHVTWTIHEGETTPEHDADQERIKADINRAILGATIQAHREIAS